MGSGRKISTTPGATSRTLAGSTTLLVEPLLDGEGEAEPDPPGGDGAVLDDRGDALHVGAADAVDRRRRARDRVLDRVGRRPGELDRLLDHGARLPAAQLRPRPRRLQPRRGLGGARGG